MNNVLLTMDSGALAVAVVVLALPDDADLLFGVALVLAGSSSGVRRVVTLTTTFLTPRPVQMRQMDVHLLVRRGGGCNRLLLLRAGAVTVRRREDAEGDGDSCFKIQLDCLCRTECDLFLEPLLSQTGQFDRLPQRNLPNSGL